MMGPARVLMTVDAVGGVWQYVSLLARALDGRGIACLLLGFGPAPGAAQARPALAHGRLVWTAGRLDWMVDDPAALDDVAGIIEAHAAEWRADLLHVNLPSQAAQLSTAWPAVATAHSCLPTWWQAVRGGALQADRDWHRRLNAEGFDRADCVVAPSASHGQALEISYGIVERLVVVRNGIDALGEHGTKENLILAAARWWDDGKNGATLDRAAAATPWPVLMAGSTTGPDGAAMRPAHARALGALAAEDLHALMRRAAIFVSPSVYEPFGLATLEAASAGAALVLADIPTYRELWDGAAVFVPPRDSRAYAAAFAALAAAPAERRRLGASARRRAATLTTQLQCDAMLAAYGTALHRHRRGAARQVA